MFEALVRTRRRTEQSVEGTIHSKSNTTRRARLSQRQQDYGKMVDGNAPAMHEMLIEDLSRNRRLRNVE